MGADAPPTSWQIAETVLFDSNRRGKLLAYARSRFGIATSDAEDLVQDTALDLLRQKAHVQSPDGFVFAVFRNRCARFLAAHRGVGEDLGSEPGEAQPHSGGSEKINQRIAVRQALKEISSACRRILAAYYIEGQSLREAAQSVALASSGASKAINRCLRKLRACLS